MTASLDISRRAALATGGLTAAGAVLAACTTASSSKTAAGASAAPTDAATPASSADSSSVTSSSADGAISSSAAGTGAALGGTAVAKLADIPVGGSISATLGGKPILLSQPTAGAVVGFSATCPHQGCTVAPAKKSLDCPCHGSEFDAATGAVLRGPAPTGLAKLTVTVSDGSVLAATQG